MARPAMRTFLFSDLRDYTLFTETKGDAAATAMLRASRRLVRAAVKEHRGAEIKTEGDSFYVVFRSPSSALRCAIDVQRAADQHTRRHPDVPVRMGIGINTGEAVPHDKGYVGSAVILASRLSTSASAGQILVTDTVRSLVRTGAHAAMRDLGAWTVKGVAQPVRVYEVEAASSAAHALGPALPLPALLAARPRSAPGLVMCPELVQREGPLAALRHHLDAAAKGEARIVALSGEGGIGKSRLVRELAQVAQREGMYVFGGRSHASGPPYEAIVDALRPFAHARGTEILRRLLGPLVGELRRLLPEIRLTGADAGGDIPTDERRERFLRTIDLLLEDAAAQRPALLVLEDIHDADEATRDLVRYLASGFHSGICIVLTFREEEVAPAHPLRALLAELDRERRLARVPLGALDIEGVRHMTAALLPGRDVVSLADTVHERSEGIPFYVEELLKTALDDPKARHDDLALPRTIADSVRLRVSRLVEVRGPGIADLLEAAAIAEVPLGFDLLVRLAARDDEEAGADLTAAVDAQLLERPALSDLYQFRHALTREAIVAGISPARRRRLHARVAAAIEAEPDPSSSAALLARHFAAAGDRSKARVYARQGAAEAVRVGAYASAIDLLREAASMAAETPDEADVLEELAAALQAAGRAAEAEEAIESARAIMRARGEARRLALLDVRLAGVLRIQGRRTEAAAAAQRAVAALEPERDESLAEALVTLADLSWTEHNAEAARALAAQALPIARERHATRTVIRALTILGAAELRLGRPEGAERLTDAISLGVHEDLPSETADAYHELARAQLLRGQAEEAGRAARSGLALARQRGLEFAQARLLAFLTTIEVNEGRYREARITAEQALALARPGTVAQSAARIGLANVLIAQGDARTALALLDRVREDLNHLDPDRRELFHAYRAQALLVAGALDEAKVEAEQGVRLTEEMRRQGVTTFLNAVDVAEARRDASWIREIEDVYERYYLGRDTPPIRAVRAEISAVRALCEGRDPVPDFARAAREYEAMGAKGRGAYRRASSLIAQLADETTAPVARRELASLRELLRDRGARRYVALIDTALRHVTRPERSTELLDGEDLRVALLVAQGLTDGGIAADLGVSATAASRLVRRVLDRLGIRTRSQLASWAVKHRERAAHGGAALSSR